jgi:transcription initiation factor IIE alpha subunit
MPGKCPKCNNDVTEVNITDVTLHGKQGDARGITFNCPSCKSVLSVTIDPQVVRAMFGEALKSIQR